MTGPAKRPRLLKLEKDDCNLCCRCWPYLTEQTRDLLEQGPIEFDKSVESANLSTKLAVNACQSGALGIFDLDGNELSGA